jgi:hypothetical protein
MNVHLRDDADAHGAPERDTTLDRSTAQRVSQLGPEGSHRVCQTP